MGPVHYTQETFRYFLALEEIRSRRSKRPFLLLLVEVEPETPSSKIFSALRRSLRETDFVGWYHKHRVAGDKDRARRLIIDDEPNIPA